MFNARVKKYVSIFIAFSMVLLTGKIHADYYLRATEDENIVVEAPIQADDNGFVSLEVNSEKVLVASATADCAGNTFTITPANANRLPYGFSFSVTAVNYSDAYGLVKNMFEQKGDYDVTSVQMFELVTSMDEDESLVTALNIDMNLLNTGDLYSVYKISADRTSATELGSLSFTDSDYTNTSYGLYAVVSGTEVEETYSSFTSNGVTLLAKNDNYFTSRITFEAAEVNQYEYNTNMKLLSQFASDFSGYNYSGSACYEISTGQPLGFSASLLFDMQTAGDIVAVYYYKDSVDDISLVQTFDSGSIIKVDTDKFVSDSKGHYVVIYGKSTTSASDYYKYYICVGEKVKVSRYKNANVIYNGNNLIVNSETEFLIVEGKKATGNTPDIIQIKCTDKDSIITYEFVVYEEVSVDVGTEPQVVVGEDAEYVPTVNYGYWEVPDNDIITYTVDPSTKALKVTAKKPGAITVKYIVTVGENTYTIPVTITISSGYTVKYCLNGTDEELALESTGDFTSSSLRVNAVDIPGYTCVGYRMNGETVKGVTSARISDFDAVVIFDYCKNIEVSVCDKSEVYTGSAISDFSYTTSEGDDVVFSDLNYVVTKNDKNIVAVNPGSYNVTFSNSCIGKLSEDGKYIISSIVGGSLKITPIYTVNFYLNNTDTVIKESFSGDSATATRVESPVIDGYTYAGNSVNAGVVSKLESAVVLDEENTVINFYYYKNVTLKVDSKIKTYDGTAVGGFTCTNEYGASFSNVEYKILTQGQTELKNSVKDAGTYIIKIKNAEGTLISDDGRYMATDYEKGILEIEKVKLVIKSKDLEKVFSSAIDSIKGSDEDITICDTNGNEFTFPEGEGITVVSDEVEVTTPNSTSPKRNTFSYSFNDGTNSENYEISENYGQIIMYKGADAVFNLTITANSDEVTYDGSYHELSGSLSMTMDMDTGVLVAAPVSSENGVDIYRHVSGTDVFTAEVKTEVQNKKLVGSYDLVITDIVVKKNGVDISDSVNIIRKNGTLTINPKPVTLTSSNLEKTSLGTIVIGEEKVTVSPIGALPEGSIESYTFTGTETGEHNNTFTVNWATGSYREGYDITYVYGSLTIKPMYTVNYYDMDGHSLADSVTNFVNGTTVVITAPEIEGYTFGRFEFDGVKALSSGNKVTIDESISVIDIYYYTNVSVWANDVSIIYNGKNPLISYSYTCSVEDAVFNGIEYDVHGDKTGYYISTPGEYTIAFKNALSKVSSDGKYCITKTYNGTLEIAKRQITLASDDVVFDSKGNIISGSQTVTISDSILPEDKALIVFDFSDASVENQNAFTYSFTKDDFENYYEILNTSFGSYEIIPYYTFTVRFVDEAGKTLADAFEIELLKGTVFDNTVECPVVEGYVSEYESIIMKDAISQNITVDVVYKKVVEPEKSEDDKKTEEADKTETEEKTESVEKGDVEDNTESVEVSKDEENYVEIADTYAPAGLVVVDELGTVSLVEYTEPEEDGEEATEYQKKHPILSAVFPPISLPENHWAVVNIVAAVLTIILGAVFVAKRRRFRKIWVAIPGVVAAVAFYFTEGIARSFVIWDGWSVMMIGILFVELLEIYLTRED